MSSGSLFEAQSGSDLNFKKIAIGSIALIVMCAAAFGVYRYSTPEPRSAEAAHSEEIRDFTVMMLSQPTFTGEEFREQILGKGRLVRYVRSLKDAYFTFPKTDEAEFEEFLAKYFADRTKIDHAREEGGQLKLGPYSITMSEESPRFFRTTLANIRIEPRQNLSFPYADAPYNVSLEELRNFGNSSATYGGKILAKVPTRRDGPQFVFGNHGIMVAKPDEPSLKRLTDELLMNVENNREARIQRLLDFVSNNVEYSFREALGTSETLKRASETLMTRSGDCSNKTILLASLLEQIGEEYILLYCPQHITVAVPQGGFANENKLDFTWENRAWMIAETTVPDFQIGRSTVTEPLRLTSVNYVQDPKNADVIFDASSFEVLTFF